MMAENTFTLLDPLAEPNATTFGQVTPDVFYAAGNGLAGADFAVYVTAQHVAGRCAPRGATSGTLAYAATCQRDQFDRPTFARLNICPYALLDPLNTPSYDGKGGMLYTSQLNAVVHELGHALGFSASSWPLQRHSITDYSRSPKTPRDPLFPDQVAAEFVATYSCGGAAGVAAGAVGSVQTRDAASSESVGYFLERGAGAACNAARFVGAPVVLGVAYNTGLSPGQGASGNKGLGQQPLASLVASGTPTSSPTESFTSSVSVSAVAVPSLLRGVSPSNSATPSNSGSPSVSRTSTASETRTASPSPSSAPATFALENCVHKLVGDRVVLAARAYFACDTLNGGELENQLGASLGDMPAAAALSDANAAPGGGACDFQGSHWESRVLAHEIMVTAPGYWSRIGPLTLAAFAIGSPLAAPAPMPRY